jgi:hypothetical protein
MDGFDREDGPRGNRASDRCDGRGDVQRFLADVGAGDNRVVLASVD